MTGTNRRSPDQTRYQIRHDKGIIQQLQNEMRRNQNPIEAESQDDAGPLRIALLGAGRMAKHHARALERTHVRIRIVAVVDPDPEARAALLDLCPTARGYEDLEDLLAEDLPEVVHVCTPPATHVNLGRRALEAGCHVYVEKPFTETADEARVILDLATAHDRVVWAGHQLLFERPTREAQRLMPSLGELVHVESYFSFRPVRRTPDGSAPLSAERQLLDILPHPVYLLLDALASAVPAGETRVEGLTAGRGGTIHAVLVRGPLAGFLFVTLGGRPVESHLSLVGRNGWLQADYVRGTVQRLLGSGTSGIDKVLNPYRLARQLTVGTTRSLAGRLLGRRKSYPGLVESFEAFYAAIRGKEGRSLSQDGILETVRICEEIASAIRPPADPHDHGHGQSREPGADSGVLVTGGTGFLGRSVAQALRDQDRQVRVVSRRCPPVWERLSGIDYLQVDLSRGLSPDAWQGIKTVVHCAAETSGGWDAHRRNSIQATEELLKSAAAAGVRQVVHVSSLAVVPATPRDEPLREDSCTLPADARSSGPYAWGKAESERLARALCSRFDLNLTIVRPGAIIDRDNIEPPGRLGRRFGNLFVALGGRGDTIGTMDLDLAARTIAWIATHRDESPDLIHLVDPEQPTRGELVRTLKRCNPGLRVVWVPSPVLRALSRIAIVAQKLLRPGRDPIEIAPAFAASKHDPTRMRELMRRMGSSARRDRCSHSGAPGLQSSSFVTSE